MTEQDTKLTLANPIWRFALALVLGIIAMVLLYKYEQSVLLERSGGRRVGILVARAEVGPGERIESEKIEVQEVPIAYVHANAVRVEDQSSILHQKVYRKIPQNSFVQWSDLEDRSGEAPRDSALPRGMRGVPLPLTGMLSKSRVLRRGDSIDILITFDLPEYGSVTKTLFQQVLVIDQEDGYAMVALTPEQAERLVFSIARGSSSVVVRNREDPEQRVLPDVGFASIIYGYTAPAGSQTRPAVAAAPRQPVPPELLESYKSLRKGKRSLP